MSPVIINAYIASFKPISNIQPFTYRDGATYLEVLEGIRTFVNNYLVDWINTNLSELGDGVETDIAALIEQINTALETHDSEISVALGTQSDWVTEQVNTLTSNINTAVANMNTAVDNVNEALSEHTTNTTTYVTGQINSLTTYVNAQVESILESSVEANDSIVYALVNNPTSDTRVKLDSLYLGAPATDSATAANIVNPASETSNALVSLYAGKSIEVIVTEGRLSDATLDADILAVANASAAAAVGAINHDDIIDALIANISSDVRVRLNSLYQPITAANKWRAFRPNIQAFAPGIDSSVDGKYYFDGVQVHCEVFIRINGVSAPAPMGTDPYISTPSKMRPADFTGTYFNNIGTGMYHDATTGLVYDGAVVRMSTNVNDVIPKYAAGSIGVITASNPFSWGILDGMHLKWSYIPENAVAPKNFLAYGDSISRFESATSTNPTVWPWLVSQEGLAFGGGWAKDAANTAQILAGARALNADVAVYHAGVNDIAQSVAQATTLANIVSTKVKVGATKFIVCKLAPYNTNTAAIISINNAMTAWAATNNMILIDPWVAYRAGGNAGQWINAGAHTGDGVHPSTAVQTAAAAIIKTAVLAATA